jgi:LL-diaminopimelate aminotransferase
VQPSSRIRKISGYAFDEVDKLVAGLKVKGITPIDFGVGDPTVPTPEFIRNAAKEAIEKRKSSGYPSYAGSSEFRNAVVRWFRKRFNVNLDANAEVASTIGSKEAIFNFPEAFVEKDDYVIIPNPGYPPYQRGTEFAEGTPYLVNLTEENNFLPVLSEIPNNVAKKAKILWVNYPNSPSGKNATKEFYKELIDFSHDNEIIIASDEAYSELYFGEPPPSLLEFSKENVIVFNSLSKRSAMTGWRIGWVAGDENIISAFKKLKTNIDSGTPAFIQDAAIAAYGDETHVELMRNEYRQKRDILCTAFADAGFEDCTPEATIYLWQKIPESASSVEFAKKLLASETAIVATPGEWISQIVERINPGKNYVRFALVPSIEETKVAAERIRQLGT